MKYDIVHSPAALTDLEAIADYLMEKTGQEVARSVVQTIRQSCDLLVSTRIGALREWPEFPQLRLLVVSRYPKYLIFYQIAEQHIIIRRILHGSRNIEQVFKEEPG